MKHYSYRPHGVCSSRIDFDLDETGKLHNVTFAGGCNGNLKAIGKLVEGQDARNISALLRGNDCSGRGTSCADQFSKAVDEALSA